MHEKTPAEAQILTLLAKLQETLGKDFERLDADEIDGIRSILKYKETLVNIAKYDEAKGLFWKHWRGLILGLGAVFSVLVMIATTFEKMGARLWGVMQ